MSRPRLCFEDLPLLPRFHATLWKSCDTREEECEFRDCQSRLQLLWGQQGWDLSPSSQHRFPPSRVAAPEGGCTTICSTTPLSPSSSSYSALTLQEPTLLNALASLRRKGAPHAAAPCCFCCLLCSSRERERKKLIAILLLYPFSLNRAGLPRELAAMRHEYSTCDYKQGRMWGAGGAIAASFNARRGFDPATTDACDRISEAGRKGRQEKHLARHRHIITTVLATF